MAFLDFDAATEVQAPEADGLAIDLMPQDVGETTVPVVANELEF
jgi:hypothetical protein